MMGDTNDASVIGTISTLVLSDIKVAYCVGDVPQLVGELMMHHKFIVARADCIGINFDTAGQRILVTIREEGAPAIGLMLILKR